MNHFKSLSGKKLVLIPEENVKDLVEIPDTVKNKLEIHPVKWIEQVLEMALERKPQPLPEPEVSMIVAPQVSSEVVASATVKH